MIFRSFRRFNLLAACSAMALFAGQNAPAQASTVVATFEFSGLLLVNGGTLLGTFVYEYDSVTTNLLQIDSVFVSASAGSTTPAFTWAYNYPQQTTNLTFRGVQNDAATGSHQFEIQDNLGPYNLGVYLPFTGIGTTASVIVGNAAYAGNMYCGGLAGCTTSQFASSGTTTAQLGDAVAALAVPEPASFALLAVGLVGILATRRKTQTGQSQA